MIVLVDYNADRTPSLDTGSPIPLSKLASANLSREYAISATPSWVLCDHFGNEFNRFNKAPEGGTLSSRIDEIDARVEAVNTRMTKALEDARKALESKDLSRFFKAANKNFREGVVGLPAQVETIKAYKKTLEDAEAEVNDLLEERPKHAEKRLREMLKDYKGTEVYEKIKNAVEKVSK
jgi:hypothetical protein